MISTLRVSMLSSVALLALAVSAPAQAQQNPMSFFVTSAGPGKGAVVNGRGDTPNTHDVLTGSSPEGRAIAGDADMTCKNWTSSTAGAAMVGHSDRIGLDDSTPAKSWNSSHPSRGPGGGCTQDDLKSTGGAGLCYCLATN